MAIKAESILKAIVKTGKVTHLERVIVAFYVNEKRLRDIDEELDNPKIENICTDE